MKYVAVLFMFLLFACGDNSEPREWIIPSELVFDGGPGKDGIPSVDNPKFSQVSEIDFLNDRSLIVGVIHDGAQKAYPHPILDWHEITNDNLGDINYALTYCPLTGTGIAWDRNINGENTTFGVSGKLYNTNLIPYDRKTDSYWSQIRLECVSGPLSETKINTFPVVETSWETWKKAYPNSMVQNSNTGFSRDYTAYPYGDYRTNDSNIIFPLTKEDNRLPAKERVLGVITDSTKIVYSIELFDTGRIIEDVIDGEEVLVIGSKEDNYIVVVSKPAVGEFDFIANQLPYIAEDNQGNRITLGGSLKAENGGTTVLERPNAFMGYFFSFGAFYENVEIFE